MSFEADAPLVPHDEPLVDDTVYDLRLNHVWRRIVGGILTHAMEYIAWSGSAAEIEQANNWYSAMVADFYDDTIGGGDVAYHGALVTTQALMTLTTSTQVIRGYAVAGDDSHDTDGYFDAGFDTGYFKIPVGLAGYYQVRGMYHVNAGANLVFFTLRKGVLERVVGEYALNALGIVTVQQNMYLNDGENVSVVGQVGVGTRPLFFNAIWNKSAQFSIVRLGV